MASMAPAEDTARGAMSQPSRKRTHKIALPSLRRLIMWWRELRSGNEKEQGHNERQVNVYTCWQQTAYACCRMTPGRITDLDERVGLDSAATAAAGRRHTNPRTLFTASCPTRH